MNPSIVILVTGDTVITDLHESVSTKEGEEGKKICLVMKHPYKVDLVSPKKKDKGFKDNEVSVQFVKWCPFSKNVEYKIPYESVLSIGQPEDSLKAAFENKVKAAEEKAKPQEEIRQYASDVSVVGAGIS